MEKNIKMRLGDEPEQQESKIKKLAIDKTIDVVIDKAADMANISIPLSTLEILVKLVKSLDEALENSKEKGMMR